MLQKMEEPSRTLLLSHNIVFECPGALVGALAVHYNTCNQHTIHEVYSAAEAENTRKSDEHDDKQHFISCNFKLF
jgi:hypothetical protein